SSRIRHTRSKRDWSSDVCSSDLVRYRRYERLFSCLFYLVVLSDKILHRKTSKFFCLLSTAFGTHEKLDKMKVCKGLKVEIFLSGIFKKILPAPCDFSNASTRARPPLAEVAEVGFFFLYFQLKKKKCLNLLHTKAPAGNPSKSAVFL